MATEDRVRHLEGLVLGTMIVNRAHLPVFLEKLREDHFSYDTHRKIFQAILATMNAGQIVDIHSVAANVAGGADMPYSTIADITAGDDFTGMELPRHWLNLLLRESAQKAMLDGIRKMNKTADPDDIAAELRRLTEEWEKKNPVRDVEIGASAIVDRHDADSKKDGRYIRLPWPGLNEIMGGLAPGELIIVAGRPSHGKTALAVAAGIQISKQVPVAMFSIEMSAAEIGGRIKSMYGLKNDIEEKIKTNIKQEIAKLKFSVIDRDCHTPAAICGIARQLHAAGKCNMVIIDYLQLMKGDHKTDRRVEEIEGITRSLKMLARTLDIPVVLLSQLNRQVETRANKTPGLSDLRDGGSIEQDADKVLFVSRPRRYGDNSVADEVTDVLVAKNRNGKTGKAQMYFTGESFSFQEMMADVA